MSSAPQPDTQLTEEVVINYLLSDPGFFQRNAHLLSELNLPHETGSAVSLVERQVAVLRERNVQMRRRMNELIEAAKNNDELFGKIRTLTLALLHTNDWRSLNEVLATYVLTDFDADFVCCHLRDLPVHLDYLRSHEQKLPLPAIIPGPGKPPLCTSLRREELRALFPADDHEAATGSTVLVRLAWEEGEGLLAIGSRDNGRFTSDMDTLFIAYVGEVLSGAIQRLAT
ncbi:MAG: DUF484 family protein [Pseudomonadales bacterium]|nr:DUF484 family protein [Pseudomonadales bacterium]